MKERKKKKNGQNTKEDCTKDGKKKKAEPKLIQEAEDKEDCPICQDALPKLSSQFVRLECCGKGLHFKCRDDLIASKCITIFFLSFACIFSQDSNSHKQSYCKACPQGFYTPHNNQRICLYCDAGQYIDNSGTDGCKDCLTGQYIENYGCQNDVFPCAGFTGNSCKNCPAGTFQRFNGRTGCNDCLTGKYQDELGQGSCKGCPTGQYQAANKQTGCNDCPTGQYQDVPLVRLDWT